MTWHTVTFAVRLVHGKKPMLSVKPCQREGPGHFGLAVPYSVLSRIRRKALGLPAALVMPLSSGGIAVEDVLDHTAGQLVLAQEHFPGILFF